MARPSTRLRASRSGSDVPFDRAAIRLRHRHLRRRAASPPRGHPRPWPSKGGARRARSPRARSGRGRGFFATTLDLDAVFASSDLIGIGALQALAEAGRRVPDAAHDRPPAAGRHDGGAGRAPPPPGRRHRNRRRSRRVPDHPGAAGVGLSRRPRRVPGTNRPTMPRPAAVFAGIDQGTTGTRTNLYDEAGAFLATAYRRSATHHPAPGWNEQDGEELLDAIGATLTEAMAQVERAELVAIGLANQGESVIAFDRETGAPLSPVVVWSDRRSAAIVTDLAGTEAETTLIDHTGLPLDPYFSAGKIAWLLENVDAVAEADSAGRLAVSTLDGFFLHRLSGGARFVTTRPPRRAPSSCTSRSAASTRTARRCSVSPSTRSRRSARPCRATPSHAARRARRRHDRRPAGRARRARCRQPGRREGDLRDGLLHPGQCGLDRRPPRRRAAPHPGLGARHGRGGVRHRGRRLYRRDRRRLARRPRPGRDPRGGRPAGRHGDPGETRFLPAFTGMGAPWWRPGAAGVLAGLRASTTAADIAFAVLEGIAHRVADVLETIEAEQGLPDAIRVDGGLSASETLVQLQADLIGRPVAVSAEREGTAAGAAGLAAIGAGMLDLAGLAARARVAREAEPSISADERATRRADWRAFVESSAALDPGTAERAPSATTSR